MPMFSSLDSNPAPLLPSDMHIAFRHHQHGDTFMFYGELILIIEAAYPSIDGEVITCVEIAVLLDGGSTACQFITTYSTHRECQLNITRTASIEAWMIIGGTLSNSIIFTAQQTHPVRRNRSVMFLVIRNVEQANTWY